MRGVALLVLMAMAAGVGVVACGGGDGSELAFEPVVSEPVTSEPVVSAAAEQSLGVEFLGDLAVVDTGPVTVTFDSAAGLLPLADGAVLEVPAGAFAAATELTVQVADLAFDRFVEGGPEGAVYVVSTVESVELGVPVVLEVPVPAASARVVQWLGGEWRVVEVAPGASTRVPIPHFSEVITIVSEPVGELAVPEGAPAADGEAPSDFLTACLYTVMLLFADDPDPTGSQDVSLALPLAYSFCARALVTKFSPSGVRVEVGCVGDKIGGDVDLRVAIDACAAEIDARSVPETSTTTTSVDMEVGAGSEQTTAADGRYVGSLDDPGSVVDVEVGDNSVEVVVEGGSVTKFALRLSGRYSACFGGYGDEDEVSCTVWITSDFALSGGPVALSEGSADLPVTSSQTYKDCESELASECKDWDYTDVDEGTARISIAEGTMTGSFLFEGQVVEGTGFTATRQ